MSSWQCPECRTVHPDGIPACPNHEEGSVAKVSASGATQYVAEGAPVPGDLPAGVRLVGPGAPVTGVPDPAPDREPEQERDPAAEPEPERVAARKPAARPAAARQVTVSVKGG